MSFVNIGRTGPGMREIGGFGNRSTGRGTFGGELGARHCNQWGLYGVHVRQCLKRRSCSFGWSVRWAERRDIAVLHGGPRRGNEREALGFLFSIFTMGNAIGSLTVKCFRFVFENLTTFPFGKRIVGKRDSWAFSDTFTFKINVAVCEKFAEKELLVRQNSGLRCNT